LIKMVSEREVEEGGREVVDGTVEERTKGEVREGVGQVVHVLLEKNPEFEVREGEGEGGEGVVELCSKFQVCEVCALADGRWEGVVVIAPEN
jgi:hypothetical protein